MRAGAGRCGHRFSILKKLEGKMQSKNSSLNALLMEVSNEIRQKFDVEVAYEVCDVSDRKSLINMKNTLERKSWFSAYLLT